MEAARNEPEVEPRSEPEAAGDSAPAAPSAGDPALGVTHAGDPAGASSDAGATTTQPLAADEPDDVDTTIPTLDASAPQRAKIEVEYDQRVNFAMQQNDVPIVKRLRVTNVTDDELNGVIVGVWIEGGLAPVWQREIAKIAAQATYNLDRVDLALDARVLVHQTEREVSHLHVEVTESSRIIAATKLPIEVLAHNEWSGIGSLPEILAAFVTPNHPAMDGILAKARGHLEAATGQPAIDGYQSRSTAKVRQIVGAIYNALIDCDLGYIAPPASYEREGQKVRSPDQLLEHRLGTCLDLVLLMAACFEQAGLNPLVIIIEGHAFASVWTSDESFPEAATDDASRIRKRVQLGEMIAIEATALTSRPPMPLPDAERAAMRHLSEEKPFHCAIDIRTARKLRIRPLPLRVAPGTFDVVDGEAETRETKALDALSEAAGATRPAATGNETANEKAPAEPPHARLERWKRKLLDLSNRNRLINFRDSNRSVPLLAPNLASIEDALDGGLTFSIHPRPVLMDEQSPRSAEAGEQRTGENLLHEFLRDELAARRIYSPLAEAVLQRRLLEIYRAARLSIEESGANTLYLAVGFLAWYESAAEGAQRRMAPILLIPLTLERRSAREGFNIAYGDEEPRLNVTLLEKLRAEFGVDVTGLDEAVEDAQGLDVPQILQRFRRAVRDIPRWDIVEEAQLGLFSFTKFLMWLDLQDRASELMRNPVVKYLVERPDQAMENDAPPIDPSTLDEAKHPKDTFCPLDADSSQLSAVFAAENGSSFVLEGPPGTGKSQTITNLIAQCLTRGKRVLFVAEKMAALNVVRSRLERVGLGPFCLELHSNKSSKREVLDQLAQTLDVPRANPPIEWETHSQELATSRGELNALVRTLHETRPLGRSVYQVTSSLVGLRDVAPVAFDPAWVQSLDTAKVAALRELIDRLATAGDAAGPPASHPYRAVGREEWLTTLPQQVTAAANVVEQATTSFEKATEDALRELRLGAAPRASDLSREAIGWLLSLADLLLEAPRPTAALLDDPSWGDLKVSLAAAIETGRKRDAMRQQFRARYRDSLLKENLDDLLARMKAGMTGFFVTAWFKRRGVRKSIEPHATVPLGDHAAVIADLEQAIQLREQEQAFSRIADVGQRAFGSQWNGGEADWDKLTAVIAWTDGFRALLISSAGRSLTGDSTFRARAAELATTLRDHAAPEAALGGALRQFRTALAAFDAARGELEHLLLVDAALAWGDAPSPGYLATVRATVASWKQNLRLLPDWCHWRRARRAAADAGLAPLVAAFESRSVVSEQLAPVFERSVGEQWLGSVTDATPLLRSFNSREHERQIARFAKLDREQLDLTRQQLKAKFAAQVPKVHGEASGASEMGILQRQLKLQRRHMPLRKLIQKLPNLLPRLKPCLLMSPLSVAQYLDASYPPFDIVVFDEASQIPVWDAVGAIARGAQVIVVGDSKQLPPTNFFMKADDEEAMPDEDDFEEMESILDECSASGMRSLRLLWHYRSRHESLITFSNYHYYDNRLQTFPSPKERNEKRGVSLRYLEGGVYDRGDARTNTAEAEAIVAEIVSRLTSTDPAVAKKSIGVVTFSIPQQVLIEDMLDAARRKNPAIEPFFTTAAAEPVFVKNLENVQGDERDIILFSICYGPDKTGKVAMAFGPLNRQGGERRLNVAVTRAREQVIVFSTLRADQIDLSRTSAVAVRHLKTFLDYAERGPSAIAEAVAVRGDAAMEDGLERDIAAKLAERGWKTELRVGCSGFRIDLAVRDPDQPDQFILGILCDGHFYASAPTARDRDRNRQSVLTDLGWSLHRLWSSDWWLDPQREVERIEAAIRDTQKKRTIEETARTQPPIASGPASAAAPAKADSEISGPTGGNGDSAIADPAEPEQAEDLEDAVAPGMHAYRAVLPEKRYGDSESFYAPKSRRLIRDLILRVVKREAPIQWDLLLKRITAFWSLSRVTTRAEGLIQEIFSIIPEADRPRLIDGILWRPGDDPATYARFRVPAEDEDAPRKADEVPALEYANAAAMILEQQIGLPMDALLRETAKVFGFARLTPKVQPSIEAGVTLLASTGRCIVKDGLVTLPR